MVNKKLKEDQLEYEQKIRLAKTLSDEEREIIMRIYASLNENNLENLEKSKYSELPDF